MPLKGTKRRQKKFNAHPLLRKSGNFFPPRDRGDRTAPVRTVAALEAIGKRKGWGDREEDVLQQLHVFDPFIPYQVRGGPSVSGGIKRGALTEKNQEEEIKGGRAVWWGEWGRRKGALKLTALIFFQEMASTHKRYERRGSGGDSGPPKKRKRESKGLMVPRSSQVNVLQLEQQSVGEMEGDGGSGVGEVRRSQEEVRAQGQLLILPRCWQNLGLLIRKLKCGEGHTPRQKEEELSLPPHPPPSPLPSIPWVIADECSSQMPR